jgi:hypothetical protein
LDTRRMATWLATIELFPPQGQDTLIRNTPRTRLTVGPSEIGCSAEVSSALRAECVLIPEQHFQMADTVRQSRERLVLLSQ